MSVQRMRRATITTPESVTGVRDFEYSDDSEFDMTGGDDAPVAEPVRTKTGPYGVRFELLAPSTNITTGYCASLVASGKLITVAAGAETPATRTLTFTDGYLKIGENYPSDNVGRVPVEGSFKTLAIS